MLFLPSAPSWAPDREPGAPCHTPPWCLRDFCHRLREAWGSPASQSPCKGVSPFQAVLMSQGQSPHRGAGWASRGPNSSGSRHGGRSPPTTRQGPSCRRDVRGRAVGRPPKAHPG